MTGFLKQFAEAAAPYMEQAHTVAGEAASDARKKLALLKEDARAMADVLQADLRAMAIGRSEATKTKKPGPNS
jgi:hypothetical protein